VIEMSVLQCFGLENTPPSVPTAALTCIFVSQAVERARTAWTVVTLSWRIYGSKVNEELLERKVAAPV
jgi:hypothetical protein